jgi:uncharacterized protein (UPF0264 family)
MIRGQFILFDDDEDAMYNRKLLCSVFNAQEAREAVLGGARIIDSEDPKSALGNISPRHIMAVSDSVLDFRRDLEVQLSTNIGEDQLLFRRSETGQAIEKSPYEIAGKAAQAAIGVSASMGTRVHPTNLVKVGVDGMQAEKIKEVMTEVVLTLQRTEWFSHTQVMGVLFAQSLKLWNERKSSKAVRGVLVGSREFFPADKSDPASFDLQEFSVGTLRDDQGRVLFEKQADVSLSALIAKGVLPAGTAHSFVRLSELFPHGEFFPGVGGDDLTNRDVIKAMVDATADSGGDSIMIDTSILSKVSNICLVDTSGSEMVDFNRFRESNGFVQKGILKLAELKFFVDYCHYRGISANLAGSLESYQAQQLWVLLPEVDQISTRGAASGVDIDPSGTAQTGADSRQQRVIRRQLVSGLAPPEHGGVLNLPTSLQSKPEAAPVIEELRGKISAGRKALGFPPLKTFFVDPTGAVVKEL